MALVRDTLTAEDEYITVRGEGRSKTLVISGLVDSTVSLFIAVEEVAPFTFEPEPTTFTSDIVTSFYAQEGVTYNLGIGPGDYGSDSVIVSLR